jgi:cell division protein FtsQ
VRGRSTRLRAPHRRTILRRRLVFLLSVLTVLGLGYAVLFTPLVGVRSVEVTGIHDLTRDQVRAAAAVAAGTPVLTLDTQAIHDRVAALPRVAEVQVSRALPGTVRVNITERTPVGVLKTPGGAHLVDGTGRDFATVAQPPTGLPELQLATTPSPDDRATRAVVGVLAALPEKLRPEVLVVAAKTGNDVVITLSAGREVRWGGLADSARKAQVLTALLTRDGKVFDVSSPQLPTIA